jgi:hypothetical protein
MEMVKDVLFGFGGVVIFLACIAGFIALLVAVRAIAVYAGKKVARKRPSIGAVLVFRWVYLIVGLAAMSLVFILIDGTTESVGVFILVAMLKGVIGLGVAGCAMFTVRLLAVKPFLRAFAEEAARENDRDITATYA